MAHNQKVVGSNPTPATIFYGIFLFLLGVLGFGGRIFAEEFGSGELDKIIIAIHDVRCAGKFNSSEIVANSEGDFFGEEAGMRGDDAGADNAVSFVGNEFNEAIFKIVGFAGGDFV